MSVKKRVVTSYIGEDEHAGFEFTFEPVEDTLSIKKTKTGYEARYLVRDDNSRSPDEDDCGDNALFLVGYHRDFTVDRSTRKDGRSVGCISQELARSIANGGKNEDGEVVEAAMEYVKKYHIFGLEAYIHSGVALALAHEGGFPDRQWDVSQLGLVFVSKKEWCTRAKARKAAQGLIETWNCSLSGDVYGCVRETYNNKKEVVGDHDSCWGFYGYKYAIEELKTF
jgi:hypothetical protein